MQTQITMFLKSKPKPENELENMRKQLNEILEKPVLTDNERKQVLNIISKMLTTV